MSMKIKSIDRGWRKLGKTVKKTRPRYVDVGVMEKHDARSDAVTNTMLAMVHEFGLGVPERSFIRDLIDENRLIYIKFIKKLAEQEVLGRIDRMTTLNLLGAKVEADMKGRVRDHIPPPNVDATVARKGSSTPLIDTGQLLSSIDYEVGP